MVSLVLNNSFSMFKEIKTSMYILQFSYLGETDSYIVDVYDLNRNSVMYNQPVGTTSRFDNFKFKNINNSGESATRDTVGNWVIEYI